MRQATTDIKLSYEFCQTHENIYENMTFRKSQSDILEHLRTLQETGDRRQETGDTVKGQQTGEAVRGTSKGDASVVQLNITVEMMKEAQEQYPTINLLRQYLEDKALPVQRLDRIKVFHGAGTIS